MSETGHGPEPMAEPPVAAPTAAETPTPTVTPPQRRQSWLRRIFGRREAVPEPASETAATPESTAPADPVALFATNHPDEYQALVDQSEGDEERLRSLVREAMFMEEVHRLAGQSDETLRGSNPYAETGEDRQAKFKASTKKRAIVKAIISGVVVSAGVGVAVATGGSIIPAVLGLAGKAFGMGALASFGAGTAVDWQHYRSENPDKARLAEILQNRHLTVRHLCQRVALAGDRGGHFAEGGETVTLAQAKADLFRYVSSMDNPNAPAEGADDTVHKENQEILQLKEKIVAGEKAHKWRRMGASVLAGLAVGAAEIISHVKELAHNIELHGFDMHGGGLGSIVDRIKEFQHDFTDVKHHFVQRLDPKGFEVEGGELPAVVFHTDQLTHDAIHQAVDAHAADYAASGGYNDFPIPGVDGFFHDAGAELAKRFGEQALRYANEALYGVAVGAVADGLSETISADMSQKHFSTVDLNREERAAENLDLRGGAPRVGESLDYEMNEKRGIGRELEILKDEIRFNRKPKKGEERPDLVYTKADNRFVLSGRDGGNYLITPWTLDMTETTGDEFSLSGASFAEYFRFLSTSHSVAPTLDDSASSSGEGEDEGDDDSLTLAATGPAVTGTPTGGAAGGTSRALDDPLGLDEDLADDAGPDAAGRREEETEREREQFLIELRAFADEVRTQNPLWQCEGGYARPSDPLASRMSRLIDAGESLDVLDVGAFKMSDIHDPEGGYIRTTGITLSGLDSALTDTHKATLHVGGREYVRDQRLSAAYRKRGDLNPQSWNDDEQLSFDVSFNDGDDIVIRMADGSFVRVTEWDKSTGTLGLQPMMPNETDVLVPDPDATARSVSFDSLLSNEHGTRDGLATDWYTIPSFHRTDISKPHNDADAGAGLNPLESDNSTTEASSEDSLRANFEAAGYEIRGRSENMGWTGPFITAVSSTDGVVIVLHNKKIYKIDQTPPGTMSYNVTEQKFEDGRLVDFEKGVKKVYFAQDLMAFGRQWYVKRPEAPAEPEVDSEIVVGSVWKLKQDTVGLGEAGDEFKITVLGGKDIEIQNRNGNPFSGDLDPDDFRNTFEKVSDFDFDVATDAGAGDILPEPIVPPAAEDSAGDDETLAHSNKDYAFSPSGDSVRIRNEHGDYNIFGPGVKVKKGKKVAIIESVKELPGQKPIEIKFVGIPKPQRMTVEQASDLQVERGDSA